MKKLLKKVLILNLLVLLTGCSQQSLNKNEINLLLNNIETKEDREYFLCVYGDKKWDEFTNGAIEKRCLEDAGITTDTTGE